MKKEIIISLFLLSCFSAGNSQELFRKGVWGSYVWGDAWNEENFTSDNYPHVKGGPIVVRWSELEPQKGIYQFESLIGDKLRHAKEEGFYTMLTVWVGPMSPEWIYDNGVPRLDMTKTINPLGKVRTWTFPYYLDEDYKTYFFSMIDELGKYLLALPEKVRDRLVFIQSAEGSTGDGWPYKGKPLDLRYDITRSEWTPFRTETWKRYSDALTVNGNVLIPLLVNYDSCTKEEYDWLLKNFQIIGLKNGMFSHGYHISFGKTRLENWNDFKSKVANNELMFFSRGEQDGEWQRYGWSTQNPEQGFYWSAIYATHNGLSMWNVPKDASIGERMADALKFFNRYANAHDPRTTKVAFCALRKGLDASDVEAYPESQFGKAEMKNVSRFLKIAKAYSSFGAMQGDPEKASGIIAEEILGDSAETDTAIQAMMTNAGMINRKREDHNDVGWGILDGNYHRFIQQIAPEETSYGWWHKGPKESIYSRFARSTDAKKGNKLYFDINDDCDFDGKIAVRLVWLDEGRAAWQFKYNAKNSNGSVAVKMENINSGKWLEKTVMISDAKFRNKGDKRADFIIENLSEDEALTFHLVEIKKED